MNRMPAIIQLPINEPGTATPPYAANGAGGDHAPSPLIDDRLQRNPFALLDDTELVERQRLRLREAFWISLITHGVLIILFLVAAPHLVRTRAIPTALQDFLANHQLTYVELPPAPKAEVPKQADRISDQNRVAALRHPSEQLRKLLDSMPRAGAPAAPQVAQPASPAQQAAAQAAARAQQSQAAQQQLPDNGQSRAPLTAQAQSNPFATAMSPGSRIEQAARAAAENRSAGSVGDLGTGISPQATNLHSNIDVLSDTMGVDFGPYLSRVLHDIKRNWYNLIPEEARAPLMKQGKVIIRFVITKNGGIAGMKVLGPSGDVALDRAAYGGISNSNPFQPLPNEFRGEYLALACTFYYNPDRNDLR